MLKYYSTECRNVLIQEGSRAETRGRKGNSEWSSSWERIGSCKVLEIAHTPYFSASRCLSAGGHPPLIWVQGASPIMPL